MVSKLGIRHASNKICLTRRNLIDLKDFCRQSNGMEGSLAQQRVHNELGKVKGFARKFFQFEIVSAWVRL
tara:strand:+ start:40 stop:249 length:210 start_codon:yes stop_codon:yes gene_type:complete